MKSDSELTSDSKNEELEQMQHKKKWQKPRFARHDVKESTQASKFSFFMETSDEVGPTS